MEETLGRLKDSAEACITAYGAWGNSKKNGEAREKLQEAVHELRKVAARLEIEMATSERDETNQRQIPIPPHRASRGKAPEIGNELPDFITEGNAANDEGDEDDGQQPSQNQNRPAGGPRPNRPHMGARRPHGNGPRRPPQNQSE